MITTYFGNYCALCKNFANTDKTENLGLLSVKTENRTESVFCCIVAALLITNDKLYLSLH